MNVIWSQITFWGELIGKRSDHMKWRANYCINDHILNFLLLKNMLNVSVLVLGKFVFLLKVEIARISNLKLEIVKLERNWTFSLQITFRSRSWSELRSFRGKRIVNWTRSRKKGSTLTLICLINFEYFLPKWPTLRTTRHPPTGTPGRCLERSSQH